MCCDDYVRTGHADLWLSDNYLRCGLENILTKVSFGDNAIRYVFLTEHEYAEVINHNYNLRKSRIILLTDGSRFEFLDDLSVYQFPMKSSVEELHEFILSVVNQKGRRAARKNRVLLTPRERRLIDLIKQGKRMADMGDHLDLHIKTIYQTRRALIKKMGCSGAVDLLKKLRSEVFNNWLIECH